jgi:hypothetical protein
VLEDDHMISGLLQTSEYAREFLHLACGPLSYGQDEDEIDQMVADRMQRQQVLYQPAKRPRPPFARSLARDPRVTLCTDLEEPPYAFVQVQGEAELSEDPAELLRIATMIAARYMGPDRAEEFGKRNGVPGELIVRLRPTKVLARFNLTG